MKSLKTLFILPAGKMLNEKNSGKGDPFLQITGLNQQGGFRTGNSISVCLITKNEEHYIEQCLTSVLSIASEIIVLDTGSTDRTREIVNNFALNCQPANLPVRLFEAEWQDDFSIARNESVKYATGDWVLYIDADEIIQIESERKFFHFLDYLYGKNVPVIIRAKVGLNAQDIKGIRTVIFRNGFSINFTRPIHEYLVSSDKFLINSFCPFLTIYMTRERNTHEVRDKSDKYISLLNKHLEEKPDDIESFNYLGSAYREAGETDNALENFMRAYTLSKCLREYKDKKNEISIKICELIIYDKKDYPLAYPFIEELLSNLPDFPYALSLKAFAKFQEGNYQEALQIYLELLKYLQGNFNLNPLIMTPLEIIYQSRPTSSEVKLALSRIYFISQDNLKGYKFLTGAFELDRQNKIILNFLMKYYLLENNLKHVLFYYKAIIENQVSDEFEKIKLVSKLPIDSVRYLSYLLTFLTGLKGQLIWNSNERQEIDIKIKSLHKAIEQRSKLITEATQPKKAAVSICVIIDGKENFLENSLKSVEAVASEIIFLNIGAKNEAKEIAEKFGRVYDLKFQGNFNELRKTFHEKSKSRWLLFLDPEEELSEESQLRLLNILEKQDEDIPTVFYGKSIMAEAGDRAWESCYRPLLVNKDFNYSFFNPYFKQPVFLNTELKTGNFQELIFYNMKNFKPDNHLQQKKDNDLKLILEKAASEDCNNQLYYLKYAGDIYKQNGESDKALDHYYNSYNSFKQKNLNPESVFFCELLLGLISLLVLNYKKFQDGIYFINELLEIMPEFTDALFYQAFSEQQLANYQKAASLYEHLLTLLNDYYQDKYPVHSYGCELVNIVMTELSRCYTALGNDLIALNFLEKSLAESPDSPVANILLAKHYLLENNLSRAIYHFSKTKLNLSEDEKKYLNDPGMISLNYEQQKTSALNLLIKLKQLDIWSDFEIRQLSENITSLS